MEKDMLDRGLETAPPRDQENIESPADKGTLENSMDEKRIDSFIDWVMENSYADPFTLEDVENEFGKNISKSFLENLVAEGTLQHGEDTETYVLVPESKRAVDRIM
jgi:hypothetical protein